MNGRTARYLAGAGGFALALSLGSGMALADDPTEDGVDLDYLTAEEKLAHDVYVTLGETWDARQFDKIADSETQHLEAWRRVLTDKGLTDPTAGDAFGVFDDPELQAMYDEMVARGLASLDAAAGVGIEIEQNDIRELGAALAATDDPAISKVLTSQLAASERHLAAFQRLAGTSDGTGAGATAGTTAGSEPGKGQARGGQQGAGGNGPGSVPENRGPHADGADHGDCDNDPQVGRGQPQGNRFGPAA